MSLNANGLNFLATQLQTKLVYAQLHSGVAGVAGTDNIGAAARQLLHWGTPAAAFALVSSSDFTGGTPLGDVYSVTAWDLEVGGTCYGEFPLSGDVKFNGAGAYSLTAIDVTGTAVDA